MIHANTVVNQESIADTPTASLREAVLSGKFFARARAISADAVAEFLDRRTPAPLSLWFGAAHCDRLMASGSDALRGALDRDIAAIDALIGAQVDAILHNPRLQRLEGAWRGLAWLVGGIESGNKVKTRVLSISWNEICRDLERAAEFDASQMFRKIYEDEFGTPGGEPFGLMVIDHEVRHRPGAGVMTDDVGALTSLAAVGAAAFVPMVLSASPHLLDLDHFADLAGVADPTAPLRDAAHQRFRGLAGLEDARFIALALPRMLARPPWGDDPARRDGFRFQEQADDATNRVWMGAGFAFAAVAARAVSMFGWPANVRGVEVDEESGGLVTQIPLERFATDPGYSWVRHPLEIQLTDRQEQALVSAGLLPLATLPYGPDAVFCAVPSLQVPKRHQGPTADAANANARISSQISAILCVARFAHCVKMMGRDMIGAFQTTEAVEMRLQEWLTRYVNSNLAASGEARARFPLVAAQVSVRERPGRPGVFGCAIHLQPHYQLDNVAATFRLMTDISAPRGRV